MRIGQNESRHRKAVKVWDKREFKNLADDVELGTRNIKVALRRLRKFARQGAATELDLKMVLERHNSLKVFLFFDVGGSMDDHIKVCEELFSATRSEFKHMEYFYFHNCLYEHVWKSAEHRWKDKLSTWDLLRTYGEDYKVVIVEDATMSPYEIVYPGGSVEHWNEEAGQVWLKRLLDRFSNAVWINPQSKNRWEYHQSIKILNELMKQRMYPLTLAGLEAAMKELL